MFKRLSNIKNLGIFADYNRTGNIEDFKKLNIIYGWNYSGKTTLSRLFKFFEKNQIDQSYPQCSFKVTDVNDQEYTEDNLESLNSQVRVFNTDFVKDNLKWDGETFEPILLLGEDSISAQNLIEKEKKKELKSRKVITKIRSSYVKAENSIEEGLTKTSSQIKKNLELVHAFSRTHLRPIFDHIKPNHSIHLVDEQKEKILLKDATASENDKLPKLKELNFNLKLTDNIKATQLLAGKVPDFSETIEYLKNNKEIADWIETGVKLHQDKDTCEFCENKISSNRRDQLSSHFSEDLKNHKSEIDTLSSTIQSSKLFFSPLSEREIYQTIRREFKTVSAKLESELKSYNSQLDKLSVVLSQKKATPFEKITNIDNVIDSSEALRKACQDYNKIIIKNNSKTSDFEKDKKNAIDILTKHYTAKFIEEIGIGKKESKIVTYKKREQTLVNYATKLNDHILELEAKISSAQKGREQLNIYISNFLGHSEINIEVFKDSNEKERFGLKRGSDNALNLSEGEKTAIAFSFFLTKLLEIDDLKNTIVYIDDPISSLDSNHIFQVNAVLKKFFFYREKEDAPWLLNCNQLFISTHNFEFFSLLREPPRLKSETEYYYVKRYDKNKSTIERLPKSIRTYTSEYHFLFAEIYRFHTSERKDDFQTLLHIPNVVRRFVELYTYARIPGNFTCEVDRRMDTLFGREKSKRIMKILHYFSHSNNIERIMKNNDLVCDIETAIDDLICELKKDTLHYEALEKTIQ